MIIDFLLWHLLQLWQPAKDIDEVPDFVFPNQQGTERRKTFSEDSSLIHVSKA